MNICELRDIGMNTAKDFENMNAGWAALETSGRQLHVQFLNNVENKILELTECSY